MYRTHEDPQVDTRDETEDSGDRGRRLNPFWMGVLWVVVVVLAFAPYPWF
jgi:hypothetical protein